METAYGFTDVSSFKKGQGECVVMVEGEESGRTDRDKEKEGTMDYNG